MKHLFGDDSVVEKDIVENAAEEAEGELDEQQEQAQVNNIKRLPWQKQKKIAKKAHNKKGPSKKPLAIKSAAANHNNTTAKSNANDAGQEKDPLITPTQKKGGSKKNSKEDFERDDGQENDAGSESEGEGDRKSDESDDEDNSSQKKAESDDAADDDENEWMKFQERLSKRDRGLEARSNKSHEVHCPRFPDVKQEYWWVYLCDKKAETPLTQPTLVTSLVDKEEFQLRLSAPAQASIYTITACLRSDSYFGFNEKQDIKVCKFDIL